MPRPCADRAPRSRSGSARRSPAASAPAVTRRSGGGRRRRTRERSSGPWQVPASASSRRGYRAGVGAGAAITGLGGGSGETRAIDAARQAIASPLLEASIEGARGILFNISGPADLRLNEVRMAADEIRASADPDANVIFGASLSQQA